MIDVEILLLALALSADAFSVGAVLGLRYSSPRQVFRLAFHFGLFQALLPLAGVLLGTLLVRWVAAADHWIAFGLLAALGIRMIRTGVTNQDAAAAQAVDLTRGWSLVGFSLAVSIDALAAGITFPTWHVAVAPAVATFGIVTAAATAVAMTAASSIAGRLGGRVEIGGGCVLIALGLKILSDHLHLLG